MDVIDHRPRTTPTNAANGMRYPELWMLGQNGYSQEQMICSWNTTPNKEVLIRVISDKLCQNGYKVVHASGDADIDIVEAAVSSYLTKSTTLMERKQIFWCFSFSTHKVFKICSSSGLTNQKTCILSLF